MINNLSSEFDILKTEINNLKMQNIDLKSKGSQFPNDYLILKQINHKLMKELFRKNKEKCSSNGSENVI